MIVGAVGSAGGGSKRFGESLMQLLVLGDRIKGVSKGDDPVRPLPGIGGPLDRGVPQ